MVFFVWQNEVDVAKPHFWAWTFKGLEASLAFVVLPSSWEVPAQATLCSQTEEERLREQSGPCQEQARGASCSVGARVSKCGSLHSCGWLIHPLPLHHSDLLGKKETAASHMAKGTPESFHFFFKAQLRVLPVPQSLPWLVWFWWISPSSHLQSSLYFQPRIYFGSALWAC